MVAVNFDLGAHLAQFATYFYGCALLGWHCLSRRFCNFGGRASRREYWSYTLIIKPCLVVASFIASFVGTFIGALVLAYGFSSYYYGKSGWWVLVPFANFFLRFKKSDEEWNIYGEPPVDDI